MPIASDRKPDWPAPVSGDAAAVSVRICVNTARTPYLVVSDAGVVCGAADGAGAETCASGGDGVADCVKPGVDFLFAAVRDQQSGWRGHRQHLEHAGEISEQAVTRAAKVGLHRETGIVIS